jgi:hypothetical protein
MTLIVRKLGDYPADEAKVGYRSSLNVCAGETRLD